MLKENQTARLSKERQGGHSNGGKGSSLGHDAPNSQNKRNLPIKRAKWSM